ncbi:MAG: POTRA domain-containing protein [Bryobacteraceae bacterium]
MCFFERALILAVLSLSVLGQGASVEGLPVRVVRYDPPEQPLLPEDLKAATTLTPGQPFHAKDAADTIDRLFATGRYEDVQVDVERVEGGLDVRVVTTVQWFVGHINIGGDVRTSPTPNEVVDATRLRLGEAFHDGDIQNAEEAVRRLLERNGLYEAHIVTEIHDRADIQQRDIDFNIDTGLRAHYGDTLITGDPKLSETSILRATGWWWPIVHYSRKVTQERTSTGLGGILRKYQDEERLMANVSNRGPSYSAEDRRISSVLDINAGPRVQVRATGAKVSQRTLKRYVPVFTDLAVNPDLLNAGSLNLRDYFQSKGYFETKVAFEELTPDPDLRVIEYSVDLGPRYKLVHIEIVGNKFFSTADIRERMFLQESGFLRLRYGRYSEVFVERDSESITNLYKTSGFRDVSVTAQVDTSYQGHKDDVAVTLTIDEGPMWLVSELRFSGVEGFNVDELKEQLSSQEQQPFSDTSIALDRNLILTRYQSEGYSDARFQWNAIANEEQHLVTLTYEIYEGERQTVREVVLSGIRTTDLKLVQKQITMAPGDPLSLIKMADIQRRLYQLGVFSQIRLAVQNPTTVQEPKRVLYDFHEGSRYSIAIGFGAEFARIGGTTNNLAQPEGSAGFSPRVSMDLSRYNFLGRGHAISLRGRVSRLEQIASLNYLAPRFRGVDNRNVSLTGTYQVSRDVRTFSSRKQEIAVQVSQQLSKPTSILVRFAYRRVAANNIIIPRLLIPQLLQPIRIGILTGTYVQDRRDDAANATRGIYTTLDFGLASSIFGSQRTFVRGLLRNSTYHPITRNVILARETSAGVIVPFRIPADLSEFNVIPLPERFFGGGSASHRGFPENQAGPRDTGQGGDSGAVIAQATGFPLGGSALFFNKVELRFPFIGDNIGGVVFHDMGNVFATASRVSFRVQQRGPTDFDYMVHAVGYGIRYKTPVGPIRVDLAYSLNPPRYQGFIGTQQELLQCGQVGTPQACKTVDQRINHLQFFFSIGQTF